MREQDCGFCSDRHRQGLEAGRVANGVAELGDAFVEFVEGRLGLAERSIHGRGIGDTERFILGEQHGLAERLQGDVVGPEGGFRPLDDDAILADVLGRVGVGEHDRSDHQHGDAGDGRSHDSPPPRVGCGWALFPRHMSVSFLYAFRRPGRSKLKDYLRIAWGH